MGIRFTFIVLVLTSSTAWTQNFDSLPGVIPRKFERPPATDLVHQNHLITQDEALALHKNGVDLSNLNPDESSELWKNQLGAPPNPEDDNLNISENEEFEYAAPVASPFKNFRFTVTRQDANGVLKEYTILISKTVHNILLRKALLRKLGYYVKPIQHLRHFRVRFKGVASKDIFLKDPYGLVQNTGGDASRWVENLDDENTSTLEMHDAIITEGQDLVYNIAMGPILSPIIKGRRVLNALAIPYGLVEVPESVNLFAWHPGRVINNYVYIPFDGAENFYTPFEDAAWITKRILKLTRQDLADIVSAAGYPTEVAALVLEKLISRRNELRKLFQLPGQDMAFDAKISMGPNLVDGKLTRQEWDGYGSRFAWGDKESPLSSTEIQALIKSKVISSALGNLMDQVNTELMPKTDMEQVFWNHQQGLAQEQFRKFLQTGKTEKVPFGYWATPVYSSKLFASREVVAGSYLGTDNVVQLADSVGFSVDAGAFIGVDGLKLNWSAGGSARVFYNRSYTHLKPVQSIKKSLKEPYRNLMVPLFKKQQGNLLNDFVNGSLDPLDPVQREEKIRELLTTFKESLGVGESLLITDSFGGNLDANVGYGFTDRVRAQARLSDNMTILSRLHIHRVNEDTIQIYKDNGRMNTLTFSLELKAEIQVLQIGVQWIKGKANVKYWQLNVAPDEEENPNLIQNIGALREVLLDNSLEVLEANQSPYVMNHDVSERDTNFDFLLFKSRSMKASDALNIQSPQGTKKDFYIYRTGQRKGRDLQSLAIDVFDQLIQEYTEQDIVLANTTSGNPGDTIGGKSVARQISFESELLQDNNGRRYFREPFVDINYYWKGWKISSSKAQEILNDLAEKYQFQFYPNTILNETQEIQLYTISLDIFIYAGGIEHISHLTKENVRDLFENSADFSDYVAPKYGPGHHPIKPDKKQHAARQFFKLQKLYLKQSLAGELEKASKTGLQMASLMESVLTLHGLIAAVGGEENLYVHSKIQGFRKGTEDGDQALLSSHIGEFGSDKQFGPLQFLRQNLGMTESEFFLYWMLHKL